MHTRRRRIGLVGVDHYHATGWAETLELFADELEIVSLYDPDPTIATSLAPRFHDPALRPALGDRYRAVPLHSDLDELLDDSVDIAVVALPATIAPEAIARLARAGVHLLIDKPAATDATMARAAADAVAAAGVKAAVAFFQRFLPAYAACRQVVSSGDIGRVMSVDSTFVASSVTVRDPRNPLFDPARNGHGVLHWIGIHQVDSLLWVCGQDVEDVSARRAVTGGHPIDVEDWMSMTYTLAGGATGLLHCSYALPRHGYEARLAVRGDEGSVVVVDHGELTMTFPASTAQPVLSERRTYGLADPGGCGPAAAMQVADLLDAIDQDRPPRVHIEDLVRALAVVDAAYAAAAVDRPVEVGRR